MKKTLIILVLVLPFLLIGAFWLAGNALTAPVNQAIGNCPNDLACENVEFPSDSQATIKGWFLQGDKGKGAIVLMHGLRSNRFQLLDRIAFLHKAGFSIVAFDFQGSGESEGKQLTFGYLESKNAEASVKFIKEKLPNEKIGVLGISMGGAAFLLSKDMPKTDALILEMVYPTMQKAIENRLNLWLFRGADNLSPLLTMQLPMRLGVSVDDLRPIDKISNVKIPLLIIAGENDHHTTLEESKQLFAAANEPKEMWIVPNAEHGDLFKVAPTDYEKRVSTFFQNTLR